MQVPSAGFIEAAQDKLKTQNPAVIADEIRELKSALGESIGEGFAGGYALGLEVARIILASNETLTLKGINPEILL